MADLPDIDTSGIAFFAYWNAIDQGGVGSIDPSECLTDGSINSYTTYDNGVQIDSYSQSPNRTIKARVKNDGWIVAWMERTTIDLAVNTTSTPDGPWDVAQNVHSINNGDVQNNHLERTINSLVSNLSNSGSMTYNTGDVGLYNYEYPSASNTSTFSYTATDYDEYNSGGISYTADTDLVGAWTVGYRTGIDYNTYVKFDGTNALNVSSDNNYHGSLDLLANGLLPNSGTEYQMDVGNVNGNCNAAGDTVIMWG